MNPSSYRWPALQIVDPVRSGALTVFPIAGDEPGGGYHLLACAVEQGVARVVERDEHGSVPVIVIENDGKMPLMGIQGEEYVGAKQNRTLNVTILVGHGRTEIPVTCVEEGRWEYRGRGEFRAGLYETPSMRGLKYAEFSRRRGGAGGPPRGGYHADQQAAWEQVSVAAAGLGTQSGSGAMSDMYKAPDVAKPLEETIAELKLPAETRGVAVAVGSQLVGADVFENVEVFNAVWPRLAQSYAVEALFGKGASPSCEMAEEFLNGPAAAPSNASPSVGLGEDVRWEGKTFAAGALFWEGRLLHGAVFAL